jgi:hypothetical protein
MEPRLPRTNARSFTALTWIRSPEYSGDMRRASRPWPGSAGQPPSFVEDNKAEFNADHDPCLLSSFR